MGAILLAHSAFGFGMKPGHALLPLSVDFHRQQQAPITMPHRLPIRAARVHNPPQARSRVVYGGLVPTVIAVGFVWRSGLIPLPCWLSNHGGDALWALMVFVVMGFLLPRSSTWVVAVLALLVAWSVEFSQLYHAPWMEMIRASLPGRLMFGTTFLWLDLPAYAVGVAFGAWVDALSRCLQAP